MSGRIANREIPCKPDCPICRPAAAPESPDSAAISPRSDEEAATAPDSHGSQNRSHRGCGVIRWVAPSVETAEALIAGELTWIVVEPDRPAVVAAASALGFGESTLPRWVDVAITDGLRIEIAHTCATCGGAGEAEVKPGLWFPCGPCGVPDDEVTEDNAFHNGSGLVVVGTVVAVACLPITVGYIDDNNEGDCPRTPHLFVNRDQFNGQDEWSILHCDGDGADAFLTAALSVYGPAESLPGRYAVSVTDARRA